METLKRRSPYRKDTLTTTTKLNHVQTRPLYGLLFARGSDRFAFAERAARLAAVELFEWWVSSDGREHGIAVGRTVGRRQRAYFVRRAANVILEAMYWEPPRDGATGAAEVVVQLFRFVIRESCCVWPAWLRSPSPQNLLSTGRPVTSGGPDWLLCWRLPRRSWPRQRTSA